jgi:hypothetical protein
MSSVPNEDQKPPTPAPTFRFPNTPEFACCGVRQSGYSCRFCQPLFGERDSRESFFRR